MNDQIQQEQTQQTSTAPVGQLKTNKSLVTFHIAFTDNFRYLRNRYSVFRKQ